MPDEEIAFTKQWVEWTRKNRDRLMRTGKMILQIPPERAPDLPSPFHVTDSTTSAEMPWILRRAQSDISRAGVDLEIRTATRPEGRVHPSDLPAARNRDSRPDGKEFAQGSHLAMTIAPGQSDCLRQARGN